MFASSVFSNWLWDLRKLFFGQLSAVLELLIYVTKVVLSRQMLFLERVVLRL